MTLNIDRLLDSLPAATPEKRRQMRANAEGWLASGDAAQSAAATRLIGALDAQEESERESLLTELKALGTVERVIRAFTVQPMTETEARLIQVLLDHPGSTSTALTRQLGWKAQSWHLHFGTMCYNRALYLWPAPDSERRDGKFYSGILTDLNESDSTFTMKPDVAAAFARLGVKATPAT